MPLVSVIIPFLDPDETFLREAIDSVLDQSMASWELFLVDDGSSGKASDIAIGYAREHPARITYLEHEGHANRGSGISRNLAIGQARGDYVAFLDADDVWRPRKLEEQVAILESQPEAAMLFGRTLYWYSWSGNPDDRRRDFSPPIGICTPTVIEPPQLLELTLQSRACVPPPTSVLVRREALRSVGGFEEAFTGVYEDQLLYAKLCLEYTVNVVPNRWDRYRQHLASWTSKVDRSRSHRSERIDYLEWLNRYLADRRCVDDSLWRVVRTELWLCKAGVAGDFYRRLRRSYQRARIVCFGELRI